MLTRYSSITC